MQGAEAVEGAGVAVLVAAVCVVVCVAVCVVVRVVVCAVVCAVVCVAVTLGRCVHELRVLGKERAVLLAGALLCLLTEMRVLKPDLLPATGLAAELCMTARRREALLLPAFLTVLVVVAVVVEVVVGDVGGVGGAVRRAREDGLALSRSSRGPLPLV